MACKIDYIQEAALPEVEKERLEGIHSYIESRAIATGIFHKINDRLQLIKKDPGNYAKFMKWSASVTKYYGKQVTHVGHVTNNNTILRINVLPLANEVQTEMFVPEAPRQFLLQGETNLIDNEIVSTLLPEASNEPATILDRLIPHETNLESQQAMQVLRNNVDKINAKIEVTDQGMEGKLGLFEVTMVNDQPQTVIKINPKGDIESASELRQLIHHELEHAFTVGVLQNPVTPAEVNFNRNIERLTSEAQARFGNIQGTQNKFEFIAEVASNPDFKNQLRGLDLWSRFVRNVRNLLGLKDSYDKILETRSKIIDSLEDAQKNLAPGAFAKEISTTEKEKVKGKKELSILEKIETSLKTRLKELKRHRGTAAGKNLAKDVKEISALIAQGEENLAIVSYLTTAIKEVDDLQKAYDKMDKNPEKINPNVIAPVLAQLKSYSILDELYSDFKNNTEKYVGKDGNAAQFLGTINRLRGDINNLKLDVNNLVPYVVANFIKENLETDKPYEEIVQDLKVAPRDINWWSLWETRFSSMRDDTLRAFASRYGVIRKEAYRDTQEELYTNETKTVQVKYIKQSKGKNWTGTQSFKITGMFKALTDYEKWLKDNNKPHKTQREKADPILDQESFKEGSNGVQFIDPSSKEGQAILAIKEGNKDYPLRQYYETVVGGYLSSQEEIKLPSQRPGLRVPSIGRSLLEGFQAEKSVKGQLDLLKEQVLYNFIERFDNTEYAQVDQDGHVRRSVPIRYVSKQDGKDGHFKASEISLDVAQTTMMFRHEMHKYGELIDLQDTISLAEIQLSEREVMLHKNSAGTGLTPLLSSEVEGIPLASGKYATISGAQSNIFRAFEELRDREQYGILKKREGETAIGGKKITFSKAIDWLIGASGLRIMFGKIAIPLTNELAGELYMLREMTGGNLVNKNDYFYGQKMYLQQALPSLRDYAKRQKVTEFGKLFTFFNPMDNERPVHAIGIDSNWMKTTWNKIVHTGGSAVEYKLAVNTLGMVMHKFKVVNKEGEMVPMDQGVEVSDAGKITLKPGFKYAGKDGKSTPKSTLENEDIDKIINYTLRLYQLMNGVYNTSDKPASHAYIAGRLVNFMRSWLPEGIAARWNTKTKDIGLDETTEGFYVSSLVAFNNMYSEKGFVNGTLGSLKLLFWLEKQDRKLLLLPEERELPEQEQEDLIDMRRANMRKMLFEVAIIVSLGILINAGFDDDDESFAKYMLARIQREMQTFYSPMVAWDVLRSPTVALNTVQAMANVTTDFTKGGFFYLTGQEQPVLESGPYKGATKAEAALRKLFGDPTKQFDDLNRKTDFVLSGGFR